MIVSKGDAVVENSSSFIWDMENAFGRRLSPFEKVAAMSATQDSYEDRLTPYLNTLSTKWGKDILEKSAEYGAYVVTPGKEEKKPQGMGLAEKAMYGVGGLGVGMLLAFRGKNALSKIRDQRILEETAGIRALGDDLVTRIKENENAARTEFESLFDHETDLRKKNVMVGLTKDIDKLINVASNSVPQGRNATNTKIGLGNHFYQRINETELPQQAKDYLNASVERKFIPRPRENQYNIPQYI